MQDGTDRIHTDKVILQQKLGTVTFINETAVRAPAPAHSPGILTWEQLLLRHFILQGQDVNAVQHLPNTSSALPSQTQIPNKKEGQESLHRSPLLS